jgi:hypothetical protein
VHRTLELCGDERRVNLDVLPGGQGRTAAVSDAVVAADSPVFREWLLCEPGDFPVFMPPWTNTTSGPSPASVEKRLSIVPVPPSPLRRRTYCPLGSGGESNMRLDRDGQVEEGVWSGCRFWS